MINKETFINYMLQSIKPWAKIVAGGREINCRCFYCSDSENQKTGHMYIKIPQQPSDIPVFYCQKCKTTGMIDGKRLISWGIYDTSISTDLTAHNKIALAMPENMMYRDSEYCTYRIYNDKISDDKLTRYKLNYINTRLGTSLTYTDCMNMKIVLNIGDILSRNHLKLTRDKRIIEALDSGFLGFLSHDNAFLNMRNLDLVKDLHASINKRYINYNLVGKYDNTCRFYNVPTTVDFRDPRPIKLHIAEGSFDILSIYLNLRKDPYMNIYTAIGGSGYKGLAKYFISKLKCPNLEIHIYPDNDVSRHTILDLAHYLEPFRYSFYIHRNICPGEKDFGVNISKIQESIERVY